MTTRPLVVRFGALGDMVMITPLLRILAQRSGQACDVLGSGAWCEHIFKELPWVNKVYSISGRKTPYWFSKEQRELVAQLKQREQGPLWLLEDMPKAWRLLQRAGFSSKQAVRMIDAPRNVDEHTVQHWLRLAQRTPIAFDLQAAEESLIEAACELRYSDEERQACSDWLAEKTLINKPLILIQPGSKKTMKGGKVDRASNLKFWPRERWAAVIKRVLETMDQAQVLLCGAPSEQEFALEIKHLIADERVHAMADQLPLRRLIALMGMAHSCISVDTGPAHIAAACRCPLVVLFGQTNPRLYQPMSVSSPVKVVSQTAIEDVAPGSSAWAACNSMDGISVDKVFDAWSSLEVSYDT